VANLPQTRQSTVLLLRRRPKNELDCGEQGILCSMGPPNGAVDIPASTCYVAESIQANSPSGRSAGRSTLEAALPVETEPTRYLKGPQDKPRRAGQAELLSIVLKLDSYNARQFARQYRQAIAALTRIPRKRIQTIPSTPCY